VTKNTASETFILRYKVPYQEGFFTSQAGLYSKGVRSLKTFVRRLLNIQQGKRLPFFEQKQFRTKIERPTCFSLAMKLRPAFLRSFQSTPSSFDAIKSEKIVRSNSDNSNNFENYSGQLVETNGTDSASSEKVNFRFLKK